MIVAIYQGIQWLWQSKKMLLIVYLINLLFGIVMVMPFRQAIAQFGGHSLLMQQMAGRFNMDFLMDFIVHEQNDLVIWGSTLLVGTILYQLLQLFLSGGIYAVFLQQGQYTSETFWGNAARYWGRFIRLFLWSLLLLAAIWGIVLFMKGFQRLIWGKHPYETVIYWNKVFRIVLLQLLLIVYFMVMDFSRLITVHRNLTQMRRALTEGLRFVKQHPFTTIGLGIIFQILTALALLVYNPIANILHSPAWAVIFLLFVWQQLYMALRLTLRLTLYAAETAYLQNFSRAASLSAT